MKTIEIVPVRPASVSVRAIGRKGVSVESVSSSPNDIRAGYERLRGVRARDRMIFFFITIAGFK